MEIILSILGIFLILGIILTIVETIMEWYASINWGTVILTFFIGTVILSSLFSFTAEGILVVIVSFLILGVISFLVGLFKRH